MGSAHARERDAEPCPPRVADQGHPRLPGAGDHVQGYHPPSGDPAGLSLAIELMVQPFRGERVDYVAGAESRGFIFATALASKLSAGFVPIRKPGRLPYKTRCEEYSLEYGTNSLHIHEDAIEKGARVLVADDLLATGGTMAACCRLVQSLGGEVIGTAFLIELEYLKGRSLLEGLPIHSVLRYPEP